MSREVMECLVEKADGEEDDLGFLLLQERAEESERGSACARVGIHEDEDPV